jgi:hypothetical protein
MRILGTVASASREAPNAPTIGTATNVGTARPYNNGSATVTFTAPVFDGGLPITAYTVTSSPGGFTGTGASSPITVTGLQSSVSYTFTVTATNARGTGAASAASNSITATTVPQAPTIGTATAGTSSATVGYTAGATGGSAITTFTATSSPGGQTGTGTSPITVSGLTSGTAYTFTVRATNANGQSAASAASNSITTGYAIGSTGPGGGIVFYDAGSTLSWGRYIEVATPASSPAWDTAPQLAWIAPAGQSILAGTADAIGTGLTNTNAAVAVNGTAGYAVTNTRSYNGGGRTDWFLPSINELNQLLAQKAIIGAYGANWTWSSSENGASAAKVRNFDNNGTSASAKFAPYYIRAVRYFS